MQKSKTGNLGQNRLLRRSVGNPCHDVDLRRSVGCLTATRPSGQNCTPRVHHGVVMIRQGVAVLHHGEGLRRSVVVLRHGVDTVHSKKIFGLLFRKSSIRTPNSLRTLIND